MNPTSNPTNAPAPNAATTPSGDRRSSAGKYLTFALGKEEYGLEILKVREIIGYMEITHVPRTAHDVRGVINLRGQVITVIDLRSRFGMPEVERTDETCIIVVETRRKDRKLSTGLIVDRVSEVLNIGPEAIEPAPNLGEVVSTEYLLGMAKIGEYVKILLDIDRVLDGSGGLGAPVPAEPEAPLASRPSSPATRPAGTGVAS